MIFREKRFFSETVFQSCAGDTYFSKRFISVADKKVQKNFLYRAKQSVLDLVEIQHVGVIFKTFPYVVVLLDNIG